MAKRRRSRRGLGASPAQRAARARFKAAARVCVQRGGNYRSCMKQQLRK